MTNYMSQTLVAKADKCPHSAWLYRRHRDADVQSIERNFGSLFHLFAVEAMRSMLEAGEKTLYVAQEGEDIVKAKQEVASLSAAILDGVMREHPELALPARHHSHSADHLRECAYHWAIGYDVGPDQVLGLEQTYELDVAGIVVRCRIDVIALLSADTLAVDDYKTSFAMPDQAGFEDRLQVPLYCCAVAFGNPVDENGERQPNLSAGLNWFRGREVFPRFLADGEETASRTSMFSRTDLADFLVDVERKARETQDRFDRVEAGEDPAEAFPAIPSGEDSGWCSQCPCAAECPLPPKLRNYSGSIQSMDQATKVMQSYARAKAGLDTLRKDARRFASEHGPIPLGGGKAYGFAQEAKRETDYDGMTQAAYEAANFGRPFDAGDWIKRKSSMRFKVVDVDEESAKGEEDVEARRDEQFGAAAPF